MTSVVWDEEIGKRLAQMRGQAPTGRVYERWEDGTYVDSVTYEKEVLAKYDGPSYLGAHAFRDGHCIDCGVSGQSVFQNPLLLKACRRSPNWRLEQHIQAMHIEELKKDAQELEALKIKAKALGMFRKVVIPTVVSYYDELGTLMKITDTSTDVTWTDGVMTTFPFTFKVE